MSPHYHTTSTTYWMSDRLATVASLFYNSFPLNISVLSLSRLNKQSNQSKSYLSQKKWEKKNCWTSFETCNFSKRLMRTGYKLHIQFLIWRYAWIDVGPGFLSRITRGLTDYRWIQRDWPASADKGGWQYSDRLHPSNTEVAYQPLLHNTANWWIVLGLTWRPLRCCLHLNSAVLNCVYSIYAKFANQI